VAFEEARVIIGPVIRRDVLGEQNIIQASGRQTTISYRATGDRSPLEVLRNF
jgi:hypothetical protein